MRIYVLKMATALLLTLFTAAGLAATQQIYTVSYAPDSELQPHDLEGSTMNMNVYSGAAAATQTQATIQNGQATVSHDHHDQVVAHVTSFEEQPNSVKCSGASNPGETHINVACHSVDYNKIRNFVSR